MKKWLLLIASISLLNACMVMPQKQGTATSVPLPKTAYDVVLYDSQREQRVSLNHVVNAVQRADVIFIGEYHGNHGSHWLQAQLQAALFAKRPQQVLTMEQFSRDKQVAVDQYLQGKTGEVAFIKESNAWANYKASYRPLVEFAKKHQLPIVAANAPADSVRCIGREGETYLEKLSPEKRQALAKEPFRNDKAYQAAFAKVMHAPPSASGKDGTALSNSYLAQLSRDNTMAESILEALERYPQHQIIHMNGAFHSDQGLGTVALLKQRRKDLKVVVISPVHAGKHELTDLPYTKGNYLYLVDPQPKQYVSAAERNAAFSGMFAKSRSHRCQ